MLLENFCFENCIRKSGKSILRETRDTLLESLRVEKPPRIVELPKVIPKELKKADCEQRNIFCGHSAVSAVGCQAQQERIVLRYHGTRVDTKDPKDPGEKDCQQRY